MSAPRIPIKLENWLAKNKKKDVAIWFHDDLDGIYSAVVLKNWLLNRGFNITRYGVVNYQDAWSYVEFNENEINIAVDFSEVNEKLDCYIDHHGQPFDKGNKNYAIKCATHSAYEAVCLQLGLPCDEIVLSVIDMVDSAKYEDYGVDIRDILDYDLEKIKSLPVKQGKLLLASVVNQFIKRSDYTSLIEVVHNIKDVSIYNIFRCFKILYPLNNGGEDFIEGGQNRIYKMKQRTKCAEKKKVYKTQSTFVKNNFDSNGKKTYKGYQIIGNLAYFPSSTWANPIRAKSIVHTDMANGLIPKNIKYILLQYGNTLQVAYTDRKYLTQQGNKNLGKYMTELMDNSIKYWLYPAFSFKNGVRVQDTVGGGHKGIGTISNIFGYCQDIVEYKDTKYLHLLKNKIIKDLSSAKWDDLTMSWGHSSSSFYKKPKINSTVIEINKIKLVDKV